MTAQSATLMTRIGPFTTVVADTGAVLASGWTGDVDELVPLIHPTLRPAAVTERRELGRVTDTVRRYHDGELTAIDDVAVEQVSGEFLVQAWKVLREVQAGHPLTYTEFAASAGRPEAVRAAANACARNAAALFVPCHRVIRNDGSLGGFRWGLDAKRWLLDHEEAAGE